MTSKVSDFPDHPEEQRAPMIAYNGKNYWIGNLVKASSDRALVKDFFKKNEYRMKNVDDTHLSSLEQSFNSTFGVSDTNVDILVSSFKAVIYKSPDYFRGFGYTVTRNIDDRLNAVAFRSLKEEKHILRFDQSLVERYKRRLNNTNSLMKAVVASIILYSDDMSGNRSNQ
ncbi:hypothetical protein CU098_007873 [Rhizopus stolonifer]|uniref:Uncharacterized protein n=1 Tax=Rhizopus stolonifer TaxID=4846 RepID=A0A367JB87_RHIST|nr:hypothetical protein CU098_007873 [Rhizopus stolonifer]